MAVLAQRKVEKRAASPGPRKPEIVFESVEDLFGESGRGLARLARAGAEDAIDDGGSMGRPALDDQGLHDLGD